MIIISIGSGGVVREFFRLNSNSNEMNIISRLILITQKNFSVVLVQLWKILFEFIYFGNIKSRAMSSVAKRWESGERWGKINEDNSASSPMKRHKFSQENCLYNYFKLSKVYHLKMRFLFSLCLCVLAHPLLHTIYDFLNFKITSFLFLSFIHFLFWSILPFVSRENRVFSAVPVSPLVLSAPHTSPLPCLFPLNSLRLLVVKIQHQIKWVES